ncbi:MAG: YeeE/YedE family protein [archaeon]|nr:YeeE/YedE family protein [archaeon]
MENKVIDNSDSPVQEKKINYLIFIPLSLIPLYTIFVFLVGDNWRYGFMFLISTSFGFFLKYGEIGFNRSFLALVKDFNFYQMRLLFTLFLFANIFCNCIKAFNLCPLFNENCKEYKYSPSTSPVGISLVLGSFIFGLGMIQAMCCASGTFVRLGAGNVKTIAVLIFFIIGSTFAVIDPIYKSYSNHPKTDKNIEMHWSIAMLLIILLYAITIGVDYLKENKLGIEVKDADYITIISLFSKDKSVTQDPKKKQEWIIQIWFCLGLGLTMGIFYLCFGNMLGISGVFSTIGANFLKLFGAEPKNWKFFGKDPESNFLKIVQFNSDFYIFLGAFLGSAIQGSFGKVQENNIIDYIKACAGGFLMGVGSRMSYGCNIGSMTSGISANSLHGFIWMICCTLGSYVSVLILKVIDRFKQKHEEELRKTIDVDAENTSPLVKEESA